MDGVMTFVLFCRFLQQPTLNEILVCLLKNCSLFFKHPETFKTQFKIANSVGIIYHIKMGEQLQFLDLTKQTIPYHHLLTMLLEHFDLQ